MVSLEAKAEYWKPLRATPFVSFFIDFLDEKSLSPLAALDPSDNESTVQHLLTYVRDGDSMTATALYQRLTTRRLRPETEWVHNDYLVFALVCTVRKFQLDDSWLRQVVLLRPNDEAPKRLVNKTFENILAGNYNAREDYHQISVVFQAITGQSQPDAERLNKMVSYLWHYPFPWFDSEFLTIVSMRAIRAAFEAKGLLNPAQRFETERFVGRFTHRVARLSDTISWLVFMGGVGGLAILALFYAEDPKGKIVLGTLAAFGLGLGTLTDLQKWGAAHIDSWIRELLGYSVAQQPTQVVEKP